MPELCPGCEEPLYHNAKGAFVHIRPYNYKCRPFVDCMTEDEYRIWKLTSIVEGAKKRDDRND